MAIGDLVQVRQKMTCKGAEAYSFWHLLEGRDFGVYTTASSTSAGGWWTVEPFRSGDTGWLCEVEVRTRWILGVDAGREEESAPWRSGPPGHDTHVFPSNVCPCVEFSGVAAGSGRTLKRRYYPPFCGLINLSTWGGPSHAAAVSVLQSRASRYLLPHVYNNVNLQIGTWVIWSEVHQEYAPIQAATVKPYLSTQERRRYLRP